MTAEYYRLRVFDGAYELFTKKTMVVMFDIDARGTEAYAQDSKIDAMLHNLRRLAEKEGAEPDDVRLELCDRSGDADRCVYDWRGR